MTYIEKILEKLAYLDVSFDEAKEAAIDTVNIVYLNFEACQLNKVLTDLTSFCGNLLECSENTNKSLHKNFIQILIKFKDLFNLILYNDP